jgi:hypothetical protein
MAALLRRTTVVVREVLIVGVAVFLYVLVRGLVDAKRSPGTRRSSRGFATRC